jgi:hypothetical protein
VRREGRARCGLVWYTGTKDTRTARRFAGIGVKGLNIKDLTREWAQIASMLDYKAASTGRKRGYAGRRCGAWNAKTEQRLKRSLQKLPEQAGGSSQERSGDLLR